MTWYQDTTGPLHDYGDDEFTDRLAGFATGAAVRRLARTWRWVPRFREWSRT